MSHGQLCCQGLSSNPVTRPNPQTDESRGADCVGLCLSFEKLSCLGWILQRDCTTVRLRVIRRDKTCPHFQNLYPEVCAVLTGEFAWSSSPTSCRFVSRKNMWCVEEIGNMGELVRSEEYKSFRSSVPQRKVGVTDLFAFANWVQARQQHFAPLLHLCDCSNFSLADHCWRWWRESLDSVRRRAEDDPVSNRFPSPSQWESWRVLQTNYRSFNSWIQSYSGECHDYHSTLVTKSETSVDWEGTIKLLNLRKFALSLQVEYPVYWNLKEFAEGLRKLLDHLNLDKVERSFWLSVCGLLAEYVLTRLCWEKTQDWLDVSVFRCICLVLRWVGTSAKSSLNTLTPHLEFTHWCCATRLSTPLFFNKLALPQRECFQGPKKDKTISDYELQAVKVGMFPVQSQPIMTCRSQVLAYASDYVEENGDGKLRQRLRGHWNSRLDRLHGHFSECSVFPQQNLVFWIESPHSVLTSYDSLSSLTVWANRNLPRASLWTAWTPTSNRRSSPTLISPSSTWVSLKRRRLVSSWVRSHSRLCNTRSTYSGKQGTKWDRSGAGVSFRCRLRQSSQKLNVWTFAIFPAGQRWVCLIAVGEGGDV